MKSSTAQSVIVWMDDDGDLYIPETSLKDANEDSIEQDIWTGEHAGVCQAIYSYGAFWNGGSYCVDITDRIAERLSRRSLTAAREPVEAARRFLEERGLDYHQGDVWRAEPLQIMEAREATRSAKPKPKRKRKVLTPEELRAQPQFKLPIEGGKIAKVSKHKAGDVREKKAS